jgi:guanylate kinase
MDETRGKFIVIVGPSASGKTDLVDALVKKIPHATRLVTTTTRPQRPHEKHAEHYFFISRDEFEQGIAAGDFFEYADVYGNYYGSSQKNLDDTRAKFEYVFAIIDVQGARTLKNKVPDAFVIFLHPGSLDDLKRRIKKVRADISPEELQKRLDTAEKEIALAPTFDATIDNIEGHFDQTVHKVELLLKNI